MPTSAPLLYVGEADRDVRAALMAIPGIVGRVDSMADARRYLLRSPDTSAMHPHVIAYGVEVAQAYEPWLPPSAHREAPIPAQIGPSIVLYREAVDGARPGFTDNAVRNLGAIRAVRVPTDWDWLMALLANPTRTTTTP